MTFSHVSGSIARTVPAAGDAGVGHRDVEAAELRDGLLDGGVERVAVA